MTTDLRVDGMHCGNCVPHVEEALAALPGVHGVVDLGAATASVTHPASVPVADLVTAVADTGYEVSVLAAVR
jgi:P-type Cu+ transporter